MDKHCEHPCSSHGKLVTFSGMLEGEHDFSWTDANGKEHCDNCFHDYCPGVEPLDVELSINQQEIRP